MLVKLRDSKKTIWGGSFQDFIRDNEFEKGEANRLSNDLQSKGSAKIGGGASPVFSLHKVRNL